ncbi:MAG: hypothetical protein JG767_1607 [Deferribacteraceae bacterium]|nr:hypothetical protein [Deferribacteraceae bacterium]
MVDYKITDSNRNGKIEPIEQVDIKARVQNVGKGYAENVVAEIELGENVFIGGDMKTVRHIGSLNSGQYKDISFVVYGNSLIENNKVMPVNLKITESRGRFGSNENLRLVMYNPDNIGTIKVVEANEEKSDNNVVIATGLTIMPPENETGFFGRKNVKGKTR